MKQRCNDDAIRRGSSEGPLDLATHPFAVSPGDSDKFHEECGLFGIIGHTDAAANTVLGLHALQHRGQAAAGIVSYDGSQFYAHRSLGRVGDNFNSEAVISRLPGDAALGHNRYATTGDTVLRNVQPLFAELQSGGFAVGHNGNLTNAGILRSQLVQHGCIFQSTMDTEVIIHLIATSSFQGLLDRIIDAHATKGGDAAATEFSTFASFAAPRGSGGGPLTSAPPPPSKEAVRLASQPPPAGHGNGEES